MRPEFMNVETGQLEVNLPLADGVRALWSVRKKGGGGGLKGVNPRGADVEHPRGAYAGIVDQYIAAARGATNRALTIEPTGGDTSAILSSTPFPGCQNIYIGDELVGYAAPVGVEGFGPGVNGQTIIRAKAEEASNIGRSAGKLAVIAFNARDSISAERLADLARQLGQPLDPLSDDIFHGYQLGEG